MFTGIIQALGQVQTLAKRAGDARITIRTGKLPLADVKLGDSIAVNGVCLTAVVLSDVGFEADVSAESLDRTSLGALRTGSEVNLEKALTLSTPLGGHLVSGHVDGLGKIVQRHEDARSVRFQIEVAHSMARYIAEKGSICVDGISLTVNQIEGALVSLNIVPHTLAETTMHTFQIGHQVNIEVDLIARYLERLLMKPQAAAATAPNPGMTLDFLSKQGFSV